MTSPSTGSTRLGVIEALITGPPPQATISLDGDDDPDRLVNAPYLDSYRPVVGDVVRVAPGIGRGAHLVLGRAATASGWTALSTASGWTSWGGVIAGQTTPAAGYSVVSGQVIFRGMATNPAGTGNASPLVTALPTTVRPLNVKGFLVPELQANVLLRLDVRTDGEMRVVFAQSADRIISLDALRWPLW